MQVKDIMSVPAITVGPEETVDTIAKLLLENRISAVPVVDADGKPLGVVSEGDLVRRPETGTDRPTSWWLDLLTDHTDRARSFIKTHGRVARDIMSKPAITVSEDEDVAEVVKTLEDRHIKRVAVVRQGKVIGVVSRANMVRAFASHPASSTAASSGDQALRQSVLQAFERADLPANLVNVIVSEGVVNLWGLVENKIRRDALRLCAEEVAGPDKVDNHLGIMHPLVRATYGAE